MSVIGSISYHAPPHSGPLAQLVEQLAFNQLVEGSNPSRPTIFVFLLFSMSLALAADERSVDVDAIRQDVEFLAREPRSPGSEHHRASGQLCADRLHGLGYEVEWQRGVNEAGVTYANVIGRRPGSKRPEREVIVSAHYDSTRGCVGADDNASGVAGVLEAARLLSRDSFQYTVTASCWDAEETRLAGSAAYATAARERRGRIEVAYVFEMIGYVTSEPNSQTVRPGLVHLFPIQYGHLEDNQFRGDFILLVGDLGARKPAKWMRQRMTDQGGKALVLLWNLSAPVPPDFMRSDHYPFWLTSVPAIMVSDSAELRNANYHCRGGQDVPSTLNYEFAAQVVDATVYSARKMLKPLKH